MVRMCDSVAGNRSGYLYVPDLHYDWVEGIVTDYLVVAFRQRDYGGTGRVLLALPFPIF